MHEELDIPYGTGSGRDLLLDIYHPEPAASQRTAVLLFHGGGWRRGDRKMMVGHAKLLQAGGFTALPVQYRLLDEAPWPSAVHDVKAAIRWARANAERLGIDPERVVLEGFSAGAHLSLMAVGTQGDTGWDGDGGNAGVNSSVAAVAVFYPPTFFHAGESRERGSLPASALLGEGASSDEARRASPLSYAGANFPPVFFLHGGADRTVPPSASIVMHDALRAAGVATDLHVLDEQLHAFDHVDVFREVVAQEVMLFFRRMVSERAAIEERILEQSPFAQRAAEPAGARA